MERVVSATEARVHLGELLREVSQGRGPVIIERGGRSEAVVLSMTEYQRLRRLEMADRRQALQQALVLSDDLLARRGGVPLPPPESLVREGLEERMDGVLGLP